jgi:hypothetical protein
MRIQGGIPVGGNLSGLEMLQSGNPFGPSFVIPTQKNNTPGGGPQPFNLPQTPVKVFPQDQPGREGAIDVKFRQASLLPGMMPMGNAGFFYGPQYGQQQQSLIGIGGKYVY